MRVALSLRGSRLPRKQARIAALQATDALLAE
jgi:hypothetical protein